MYPHPKVARICVAKIWLSNAQAAMAQQLRYYAYNLFGLGCLFLDYIYVVRKFSWFEPLEKEVGVHLVHPDGRAVAQITRLKYLLTRIFETNHFSRFGVYKI